MTQDIGAVPVGEHTDGTSASGGDPYPNEDEVRNRSVGEIVGEISRDLSRLVRQEIELAKVETKQEVTKAGKAAGMLGGAGFAGYMVAVFGSLTLVALLDLWLPTPWAALIVTAIWAVVGAVLYSRGRRQMKEVNPPKQTIETIKEDAAWARHPTS